MATTELHLDSVEQIVVPPPPTSSSEGVSPPLLESPPPSASCLPDATDLPAGAGAAGAGAGAAVEEEEEDDSDSYNGSCECLECRTGHNPDAWHQSYYDDRENYYDDGAGLDWNESGYFD